MTIARLWLDKQGRLVIPANIRRDLGLVAEEEVLARVEEGRLILESRDKVIARLRSRFATVPPGISLAEQLIAERREAAHREATD
jgi:AbrB family looped-hinge helix DNA binding protein